MTGLESSACAHTAEVGLQCVTSISHRRCPLIGSTSLREQSQMPQLWEVWRLSAAQNLYIDEGGNQDSRLRVCVAVLKPSCALSKNVDVSMLTCSH